MFRKIIAMLLISVMLISFYRINANAAENVSEDSFDVTKCVLFAQQNTDSITITAGNLSINGDVISGGNNNFTAGSRNVNGTIYDNQEIYMLRLMPNIEKKYIANSDYYNDDYVSENYNENIDKSKYCACSFSCSNSLSVNDSAIMVGGDITIKNQTTNMNRAILASVVGDIYIESNNFSADGLIYAPLGKVCISGDNINLNGIIIAQEIIIEGRNNVNLNKKASILDGLMEEVVSAVKYGEEDTDEIDIGEIYFKDISSDDDIVYAGEGLYCVKNQFLLSVKEEIPFATINELVNEYDATIVGYIELTNDYQVEIRHDVSISELLDIIDSLSNVSFIIRADLNLVSEVQECFRSDDPEWSGAWNEDIRMGNEIAAEAIKLRSALIKAGVIPNDRATFDDLRTGLNKLYDIKIGIIDSSFDEWNPNSDIIYTETWNNYSSKSAFLNVKDYHGTKCAGVLAAEINNGIGISGICVKNRLYAYAHNTKGFVSKNYNTIFNGKYSLALLIGNNVRVISRSLGRTNAQVFSAYVGDETALNDLKKEAEQLSEFLKKFIDKGYDFIIVQAAGNENNKVFYSISDEDATPYSYVDVIDYNANPTTYAAADTTKTYGSRFSSAAVTSPDGGKTFYNIDAKYGNEFAYISDPEVKKRIVIVGAMSATNLSKSGNYNGEMCDYSNRGGRVDICALGEKVWTCTVPGKGYGGSDYDYGTGTSIATPQVAGALGLAYSVNPALTADELIAYLKRDYTDYTDETVYKKDPDKFRIKYVNAEMLVAGAIKSSTAYSSSHRMNNISDAVITGAVYDLKGNCISNVEVAVQKIDENGISDLYNLDTVTTKTDDEGFFMLNLPAGNFQVMFYKSGYHSTCVYTEIEAETAAFLGQIYLIPISINSKEEGKVNGHVVDATTGTAIEGAVVRFKKGWNNRYGLNIGGLLTDTKAYTNSNGEYDITLPIGAYTAEVTKNGYFPTYTNIIVSAEDRDAYSVLSPAVTEDTYRVVLTWGEYPGDLDSHLTGTIEGKSVHVYYKSKEAYSDGEIIASLDHDDTSGYGPETITFTMDDPNDTVTYYVHDFSNGGNPSSNALSYSNATVTLYSGNNIFDPIVYHITVGKEGTDWYVFEIKNYKISRIDRIE